MTSLLCSGRNTQHFPEQSLVQDDLISLPSDLKKKGSTFRRYNIRRYNRTEWKVKWPILPISYWQYFLLMIFQWQTLLKSGTCVRAKLLQLLFDSAILWTVDRQALCPWHSPGKNTRAGCHALLQGIFSTQGSNLHLLHYRPCYITHLYK